MTAQMTNPQTKKLREFIDAIERLAEEQKGIGSDIKDKFSEAKGLGFDVKIMRKVLALRKKTREEREEEDTILDVYLQAMGMLDTPLGDWADSQEKREPIGGGVVAEGRPKLAVV